MRAFFLSEYRLNALIHSYPKPTLAVMDGVVMGGGLGLAWPCRYRVATERTLAAMPEGAIGLFPDIGMGWRAPRMPGSVGMWFVLTGARLGAADCLLTGLATDYVPSARLDALKAAFVAEPGMIERALVELEAEAGEPAIARQQDAIDRLFGGPGVEAIMAALRSDGSAWALEQHAAMAAASPTTLKVAFRALNEGAARASLAEEMAVEYRLAVRIATGDDFREGVRARLIDKDNAPRWSPARLDEVDDARLDALFAPLEDQQEWTPLA